MRIVVCDNGLEGHHLTLAFGLKEAIESAGSAPAIWSHVALPEHARAELGATPVFDRTPYEGVVYGSRTTQLQAFVGTAAAFRRGLRRGGLRAGDVLFLPTARCPEMLGTAGALHGSGRPAAVVLNFMVDDPARPQPSLTNDLYRFAARVLRLRTGGSTLLLTSPSEAIARSLEELIGMEIAVYPMLKRYPPAPAPAAGTGTIGFLGGPRPEKGSRILLELVAACARTFGSYRIAVQLDHEPPAALPANVEVLPTELDRASYFDLLNRLDVAVLPYDASLLGGKPSGIFAEAVAAGVVTVVPSGTWMAAVVESGRGAGVVFDIPNVSVIAGAVARAIADLPQLRAFALEARDPWRETQSVSAYVDRLLGELRALPGGLA